MSKGEDIKNNAFAYEFRPINEEDFKEPLEQEIHTPTLTSTEALPEGDSEQLIIRDYTPTSTDDTICIKRVDINVLKNEVHISLRTTGKYRYWRIKLQTESGERRRYLITDTEKTSITVPYGEHKATIDLVNQFQRPYGNCATKEISISVEQTNNKEFILENCFNQKLIKVLHNKKTKPFSFIEIFSGKNAGCWVFTNLDGKDYDPSLVENEFVYDFSRMPVFSSSINENELTTDSLKKAQACACCETGMCPEEEAPPEIAEPTILDYPVSSPTSTSAPEIEYDIMCRTEFIVKKQTEERLEVKNSTGHGLIIKGCPKIKDRKLFYVWFRRSDNCVEEWMNEGKPYTFQYISEEECNCAEPYLIPKQGSLFTNHNPNASPEEENIWGKELTNNTESVYIVHMMISESSDPKDAGRKSVGFYDRYLDQGKEEVKVQLETNNYSSYITDTVNLYLSPSDQNPKNLGALHLINVGQNISHINKIFFSEKIPF